MLTKPEANNFGTNQSYLTTDIVSFDICRPCNDYVVVLIIGRYSVPDESFIQICFRRLKQECLYAYKCNIADQSRGHAAPKRKRKHL